MRAIDVANYLVERWGRRYPATIHRLNRLVYLVQVEAVTTTGEPLFEDRIEAWQCGPVVPAVTHALDEWGDAAITEPTEHAEVKPNVARLIDSVAEKYGPLSAFDLVGLVRRPDGAWARVYAPGREAKITSDVIKASADADASRPEPFSATLDAVARNMPRALKMLETS
ncbi:Panacea domain-containing protein [uncultured Parolsenella sp.]|uniref:Panacea domain-containing protein n=1 Tax=uncultured Parolsenella sp. TaxID=2083008 RepID=UPI0025D737C5|nr:Panacea domain-containing protein [uncultured Parolsenella sp.]